MALPKPRDAPVIRMVMESEEEEEVEDMMLLEETQIEGKWIFPGEERMV